MPGTTEPARGIDVLRWTLVFGLLCLSILGALVADWTLAIWTVVLANVVKP